MTRAIAMLVLLAAPTVAAAQTSADLSLRLRGGAATAPFATTELPEAKGQGMVVVLSGRGRVLPFTWVGARVPLALVSVAQPAGSYVAEAAWGNPELYTERELVLRRDDALTLAANVRLAVGLPLAERGSPNGLMAHRALAIADALGGWRDRELFVAGVVPVGVSGQLTLSSARWSVGASAKLPLLFRVSDADLPRTRAVGVTPALGANASAWVSGSFGLSLDLHAAFDAVALVVWARDVSRAQLAVQPGVLSFAFTQ